MFKKHILLIIIVNIILFFGSIIQVKADRCSGLPEATCGNESCVWDGTNCSLPSSETGTFNQNAGVFNSSIGIQTADITTPSGIINKLLPYILTLAGLILFGMLIWGGFQMLTAGTDEKGAEAGKSRITAAIIGFVIIFAAYWIAQILEIVLGINIVK